MSERDPKQRPQPGAKTVKEIQVRVCKHCGYALDDTGLCSDDCDFDADHNAGTYFYAIYRRTDEFLRDEHVIYRRADGTGKRGGE